MILKQKKKSKEQKILILIFLGIFVVSSFFILAFYGIKVRAQDYTWTEWANQGDFGANYAIASMAEFDDKLFIGTRNPSVAEIRYYDPATGTWSENLFSAGNDEVYVLKEFRGYLYAGTNNSGTGQLWRSNNPTDSSSWTQITLPGAFDTDNNVIATMEQYGEYLYVGAGGGDAALDTAQVFRCSSFSDCGLTASWSAVFDGFVGRNAAYSLEAFGNDLFLGTDDGYVYRCLAASGCDLFADWSWVGDFSATSSHVLSLEEFGSYLYAATQADEAGATEIFRSSNGTSWEKVVGSGAAIGAGFNDANNDLAFLSAYQTYLWAGTGNLVSGTEIWRSPTGTDWGQYNSDGFGVGATYAVTRSFWDFQGHLLVGVQSISSRTSIYRYNSAPTISGITATQRTDGSGKVDISFTVDDGEDDNLSARIEYNAGAGYTKATLSTDGADTQATYGDPQVNNAALQYHLSSITASPGANTVTTAWNSKTDLPNQSGLVQIRITVTDDELTDQDLSSAYVDNVPPNSPTLGAVTSPTKDTPQAISGTKDANSSVVLNGGTIVSVNANTTWKYNLDLLEGTNDLSFTSKDAFGNESQSLSSSIILDQTAPPKCQAAPSGGTFAGKADVVLEADDKKNNEEFDPHPRIYFTTDGSDPKSTSPNFENEGTVSFEENTTLKFLCRDWVGNNTSIETENYTIIPPQIQITKTAQIGEAGGAFAQAKDFVTSKIFASLRGDSLLLFNLSRAIITLILALIGFYFLLVIDSKKLIKKFGRALSFTFKRFRFAYALPIVIAVFLVLEFFVALTLIAQEEKIKPNQVLTYRIDYENKEAKSAQDVYIADPLPDNVDYVSGSLTQNGASKTDVQDGDSADFNGTFSQNAYFFLGEVQGNASGYVQFKVRVKEKAKHQSLISDKAQGAYNPDNVPFESNTITHEVEAQGKISGFVFYDSNTDKVKNANELGVSGALVKLFKDEDQSGTLDTEKDALSTQEETAASGAFEFEHISSGFYLVFVDETTLPSGYEITSNNNPAQVVLETSLEEISNVNFGYVTPGVITPPKKKEEIEVVEKPIIKEVIERVKEVIEVITKPPIKEEVKPKPPKVEKKPLVERIREALVPSVLAELVQKPQFKVTTKVLSPFLAGLLALNLLSAIPASLLWPFLRYLFQIFTEPFLFFGKRARRGWGVVYDSLTKQPVDLTIVRLYDSVSKKLLETRVTDFEGRYVFIVDIGRSYYLEVKKEGYIFPSEILAKVSRDFEYDNLYHGEIIATGGVTDIRKKEKGIISFNIPLDPKPGFLQNPYLPHKPIISKIKNLSDLERLSEKERRREDKKILLAMTLRKINFFVGFLGPILGLISFILVPSWLTGIFLVFHFLIFVIFLKLAIGKKILPWGKTYDLKTKKGLPKSLVRLFDEKYGRLLSVAVTKSGGRYGFLTGKENYFVIPVKSGYRFPKMKIKVRPTKEMIVKEDLGMKMK